MTIPEAYALLGLYDVEHANAADVKAARNRRIRTFFPDGKPEGDAAYYNREARHIIEAYEYLVARGFPRRNADDVRANPQRQRYSKEIVWRRQPTKSVFDSLPNGTFVLPSEQRRRDLQARRLTVSVIADAIREALREER